MLIYKPGCRTRWGRFRLVASRLVWLLVFLFAFRAEAGFLSLLLVCVAVAIRPAPLKEATDNQRLGAAISALITIPLIAVFLRSESAMAWMRSTQGLVLLIVVWVASVIADVRFYRDLS